MKATATPITAPITAHSTQSMEPPLAADPRPTVTVVVCVTDAPALSVTFTVTVKLPVAVGAHPSDAVSELVQPVGNPVYAYEYAGTPPVTVT